VIFFHLDLSLLLKKSEKVEVAKTKFSKCCSGDGRARFERHEEALKMSTAQKKWYYSSLRRSFRRKAASDLDGQAIDQDVGKVYPRL
jgi:hypothetical protein